MSCLKNTFCAGLLALGLGGVGHAQDASLEDRLTRAFEAGELPGLHATVVALQGEQLAEVYFPGEDERWGMPVGPRDHGPDTLHDLRSVTKSVVGLLYGIALDKGMVPGVDQPLLAQFLDYADLMDGSAREEILIEHALSMTMGMEWDESLPYSDPRNSEIAMELAEDRYRFILSRPVVQAPGREWTYSGGAVALLGKLIEDGSGMALDDFARAHLFAPLGIENFEWVRGTDGVPSAASGLRLTAPDLARIGRMVAQDGQFDGQQVVPAEWLAQSFVVRAGLEPGFGYGYLWYLAGPPDRLFVLGLGNGGQRLAVEPGVDFVAAVFSGNYNDPEGWRTSQKVVSEFAIPAAKARLAQ
ncbi:serine hydrolase domain-containing protein [Aliiroseovarius sp.]|uniref:serine hydrolase domain-containing protein n=1 Tax=Aliiroseovarius sp. TaxID=1872442 RepID=UPI003BAA3BD3